MMCTARKLVVSAVPVFLLFSAPLASAQSPGRLLASQCAQCHGTNGRSVGILFGMEIRETQTTLRQAQGERVRDRNCCVFPVHAEPVEA